MREPRPLVHIAVLTLLPLLVLPACGQDDGERDPLVDGRDVTQSAQMSLNEADIVATRDGSSVAVRVPIRRLGRAALPVDVELALRDLDRVLLAESRRSVTLSDDVTEVVLNLEGVDAEASLGDLTNLVIHYQIRSEGSMLFGRRSLFAAVRKRAVHLVSSDTFYDGQTSWLRLVATDPVTAQPLAGAQVSVSLATDDSSVLMYQGQTDEFGTVSASVEPDSDQRGSQRLVVVIDSELGSETIERPVQVRNDQRILVTTDKPLYQPGQRIHIRTLTLRRGDLLPAANEAITFEVLDGRGNKILRETATTDEFGVAATELQLARELNMGTFVIRAILGDTQSERTVTVDRYRLPRYAVALNPDGSFYEPGQEALVEVAADYLFGEPVAGGDVVANVYRVENDQESLIAQLSGTLDASGRLPLAISIPSSFGSAALDQGNAFVRLDVTVVDGAGEERDASVTLPITETGLITVIVPAHDILPNRAHQVYVLTSNPMGQPVSATCNLTAPNGAASVEASTDDRGAAAVRLGSTFLAETGLTIDITCRDERGHERRGTQVFAFDGLSDAAIAIFSDASLYSAGDQARVDIAAYGAVDRLFLDVIASGRTVSTQALNIVDGQASTTVTLPIDITGAVTLSAYTFAEAGGLLRSDRLVYVEAANDLTLSFETDREEYRPGDPATLDVVVTDSRGAGVPAAVGLQIVDEAVFALQDMRPGNERLFFQLEQEALSPQYDVQGFDIGEVVTPERSDQERERAAEILFAASSSGPGYGIVVNTLAEHIGRAGGITRAALDSDVTALLEREQGRLQGLDYNGLYEHAPQLIEAMNGRYFDPWGQAYRFEPVTHYSDSPDSFTVTGAGPDETFDSDDDVEQLVWLDNLFWGGDQAFDEMDADGGPIAGAPAPGADRGNVAEDPSDDGSSASGGDAPRVRRYFPETLLVEPALITGADGRASLDVTMADSITTWRVTGMASSRRGQLGSSTAGIRVFQPFFVDIDFPVTLTQNDEVEVPVAVFNFLDTPQTVELEVEAIGAPWYELQSAGTETLDLAAGEVTSVGFRVRVTEVGTHDFQVVARGSELSDAVRRSVAVLPDGEEHVVSVSDRLSEDVTIRAHVPGEAIPGASVLFVKLHPGLFSQVVEGLEALLRMPSGCFEQTSSSTYPNVLALDYLRRSGQVTTEVEATALNFISVGYQRLLSFEVDGGGFEWFGNTPAHRILTAYGLLEFSDMANVYEVDPAVISRTQQWLVSQQEADGSFKAAPEGIHEGATNNFRDSTLRATAYITYALLESGFNDSTTDRAVAYVRERLDEIDDAYTLALVANMLLSADPNDSSARSLIDQLDEQAEHDDDAIFWSSDSQSLTYGSGGGMIMETTALALYAFIRAGAHPDTVEGGINYLVRNKDAFGTWSSTQATILSLRTFLALLEGGSDPANATVGVWHDGDLVQSFDIDDSTADVMRLVDLRDRVHTGDNEVAITFEGTGSFLYQVVTRYYTPWDDVVPQPDPIEIVVDYPQTPIGVGQAATVDVKVTNRIGARAEMVMVEVGVPPGFDVDMRTLENHVASGLFSRVDRTPDGIEAYTYGLESDEELAFGFDIVPRFPVSVQTPGSRSYLYYEPDVGGSAEPVIVVAE